MQGFWILLLAVQIMCSCASITKTKTYREELLYGEHLSIRLSTGADELQFTSVDETEQNVLWSRHITNQRGKVTGRDEDRKFVIRSVTFDDEGTYTVLSLRNRKMSIHLLKVISKRSSQICVAGEMFRISLAGLEGNDATLNFSNQDFNLTLVKHGSPVGNSQPEYMGRIQLTGNSIELLNVNVSDAGEYTLGDHLNRKVKIIFMKVVAEHQGFGAGPLTAVLLSLCIPSCICCCCRKKICKKSRQPTSSTTDVKLDSQTVGGPTPGFSPLMYKASAGPEPVKSDLMLKTPLLTPPQSEAAQNPAPNSP